MAEHNDRTLITFSCGHNQTFRSPTPKQGETILCLRCRKYRIVITAPDEWHLKCRKCIYSRRFGQAQLNCEISAAKHRMGKPDHVVDIYSGLVIRKTFGVGRDQTVIVSKPNSDDVPLF